MCPVNYGESSAIKTNMIPDARRRVLIRRWRTVIGFGGLVLAASFFFPAIKSCGTPESPVHVASGLVEELVAGNAVGANWDDFLQLSLISCACYVFGLLVFVSILHMLTKRRTSSAQTGSYVGLFVVLCLFAITVLVDNSVLVRHRLPMGEVYQEICLNRWFPALAFCCISVALTCWARRSQAICLRWVGAMVVTYWFVNLFIDSTTYFGLWMSMGSSFFILIGTIFEAKHLSRSSVLQALWGLVRCRLKIGSHVDSLECECGYALIGLTVARCPECGREFDASLLNSGSYQTSI